MNIQKLISQIKQAKKRRILNCFHQSPRSGVDVRSNEFNNVMILLKDILKCFKSKHCGIHISFYGEILITLHELDSSFEFSISSAPHHIDKKALEALLTENSFAKTIDVDSVSSLMISVKTMRKKSQWKHYCAADFNMDGSVITENIYKDISQRVRYYSHINNEGQCLKQVTKEDKLAAIHFGGALLGKASMLFHLSKSLQNKIYVSDISISNSKIIISDSPINSTLSHVYGAKEDHFFRKYLCGY